MNCSPPGSSVLGISQARILEWVAISSSRGSSWPRDRTWVSCIGRQVLYHWANWQVQKMGRTSKNAPVRKPPQRSSDSLMRPGGQGRRGTGWWDEMQVNVAPQNWRAWDSGHRTVCFQKRTRMDTRKATRNRKKSKLWAESSGSTQGPTRTLRRGSRILSPGPRCSVAGSAEASSPWPETRQVGVVCLLQGHLTPSADLMWTSGLGVGAGAGIEQPAGTRISPRSPSRLGSVSWFVWLFSDNIFPTALPVPSSLF